MICIYNYYDLKCSKLLFPRYAYFSEKYLSKEINLILSIKLYSALVVLRTTFLRPNIFLGHHELFCDPHKSRNRYL